MNWDELVKLEPRLIDLEKEVRENRPADKVKWSDEYKPAIRKLVGYERQEGPEELKSQQVHNLVYHHILGIIAEDISDEEHDYTIKDK